MTKKFSILFFGGYLLLLQSCSNGYEWANDKPSWLGSSIYEALEKEGDYTIYLKMVDDLNKTDFLKKTGSVTVFVADDEAYRTYFAEHDMDENNLTKAQEKMFVYSTMLSNAYVLEMLTYAPDETNSSVKKGQVMRRDNVSSTIYDNIPTFSVDELPSASISHDWWKELRNSGNQVFTIMTDDTQIPMVHFLWKQMETKGITKSDFSYLFNGVTFDENDAYINNVQVEESNMTCQNGYIHKMSEVTAPLQNMADYIRTNENTTIFSKILERYSTPIYSSDYTSEYEYLKSYYADQNLYEELSGEGGIYVKRYFWSDGENGITNVGDSVVDAYLKFDPGSNAYVESGSDLEEDMGAMFVPTDQAMTDYWNSDDGAFLRNRYPSDEPFENVPDNVLDDLINNHMQYSFLSSLPSQFDNVLNDAKDAIGLSTSDISNCYVACNGGVYIMNNVYAPASFRSVLAPTLVEDNMKIMNWAIEEFEFEPYLLSMVSYYGFIILTDEALSCYIDPVTYNTDDPRWLSFYYDSKSKTVQAYSYAYNTKLGGLEGCTKTDLKKLNSTSTTGTDGTVTYTVNSTVENRLTDLLNYCIIPRNTDGGNVIGDGNTYYQTKDKGSILISESGETVSFHNELTGEDIPVTTSAEKENGVYYVVDKMIEPTFQSLAQLLAGQPEFSEFYDLLQGNEEWTSSESSLYSILKKSGSYYSMNDDNTTVRMFNTYHYTVYVPDNEAMEVAYAHGLPRWSDINNLDEIYANDDEVDVSELKQAYTERLIKFLKYHFQDNSLYIGGEVQSGNFETAASDENTGLFYTINVNVSSSDITVTGNYIPDWNGPAIINESADCFNQMVREYSFSSNTISGLISTSSYAVVHGISEPLIYDQECLCLKDNEKAE